MKTEQRMWIKEKGWIPISDNDLKDSAQLVFVFGDSSLFKKKGFFDEINEFYPKASLFGCSTAGEIAGAQVFDNSLVITAVLFEHTKLQFAETKLKRMEESIKCGERLGEAFEKEGLTHVFVLSDGLNVNGSDLVKGLKTKIPSDVAVTGGLSGDQDRFKETFVFRDNLPEKNTIIAVGFYGERLKIGYGSMGGWDSFGPDRLVTSSKGNILYELDGKPALDLYKEYLGEQAKGLPATGLLFPLSLRLKDRETGLVRTILSVNEKDKNMTFAGDVPEGAYVRLMMANFNRLIDGACGAAKMSCESFGSDTPDLAILISCVGRKLVLKQRVEEEIEGVQDTLGEGVTLAGFYSYGEICPVAPAEKQCELHNQTMTITTFLER